MTCKDCIHEKACFAYNGGMARAASMGGKAETKCGLFKNKADFVEVVRCKECEYSTWEQEPCHGKTEYYCKKLKSKVDTHFYCGCGKRRG